MCNCGVGFPGLVIHWLSVNCSGPVRYDIIDGRWVYLRDGHDMLERLESEFVGMFKEPLGLEDEL